MDWRDIVGFMFCAGGLNPLCWASCTSDERVEKRTSDERVEKRNIRDCGTKFAPPPDWDLEEDTDKSRVHTIDRCQALWIQSSYKKADHKGRMAILGKVDYRFRKRYEFTRSAKISFVKWATRIIPHPAKHGAPSISKRSEEFRQQASEAGQLTRLLTDTVADPVAGKKDVCCVKEGYSSREYYDWVNGKLDKGCSASYFVDGACYLGGCWEDCSGVICGVHMRTGSGVIKFVGYDKASCGGGR